MSQPRLDTLRTRWEADPWDTDAAQALATEAASALSYNDASTVLQLLEERYPTSARVWRLRADAAQRAGEPAEVVKEVYEEAVKGCSVSVELWRDYLRWSEKAGGGGVGVGEIFERAVGVCGVDLGSDKLWGDYIGWIRRADLSESGRRDSLRKVYQRAVRMPMHELDGFWAQYRHFEETSNSNKELGRGLIAEAQPKYVAARAEFRSRRIRREGLALTAWGVPPRGRPKEASQATQWRKFIRIERSNIHGLSPHDLHQRVVHAYECALVPLYRYPDMWIDYCSYMADTAAGRSTLVEATGPGRAAAQQAHQASQQAGAENLGPAANLADFEKVADRAMKALPECVAVFHHVSWLWMRAQNSGKALAVLDALTKTNRSSLAFVHLMRLTRKVSGKDAARKVFARARKDATAPTPAVYIAAAQMEFIVNKDNKIARNVFEFGLKHHPTDALMVHEFVEWLWGLGDFDHLRVVLKRVMPAIKGPVALVCALWERWLELEEAVGDVASVDAVEKLWKDGGSIGRAHDPVSDAVRRSRYLGLEGMREEELAIITGPGGVGRLVSGGIGGASASAGAGTGASGAAAASAAGGRRDPRTGRLVGRPAAQSGGGAGTSGVARGAAGGGPTSRSGATGGGSGRMAGVGVDNVGAGPRGNTAGGSRTANGLAVLTGMDDIESNVRRMAAGMQTINAPPPDYETLVQLISKTPDAFAATPAGGSSAGGKADVNGNAMNAGGGGPGVGVAAGKKRTGEEMMGTTMQQQQQQPPQDLFRARQAAKQSRMR